MRRLLLISNSTQFGGGYLEHCSDRVRSFLGDTKRVLFVPYALHDLDGYAQKARAAFGDMGFGLDSIHEADAPHDAVAGAQAMFIGGGNTFRLLDRLYREDLVGVIRERVRSGGMRYMGASAGSNVACRSIQTTNDMPIVQPKSFEALALVDFNLNPHYLDPAPGSEHMGETREQRIQEFHEMNEAPVVAIREGTMLRVEGDRMELLGPTGGVLFRRGEPRFECEPGADLSFLLG